MININDAIIFDFDGTLFQTEKLAIPSFKKTFQQLENDGYHLGNFPSEEKMLSVIGMTLDDIWRNLLPNLPIAAHQRANNYMLHNELEAVKENYGALYPDVVETLMLLKNKGYRLFIASNGVKDYITGISEAFRIDHFFDAIYTAGEFQTETKKDLVNILLENHSINKGFMVGDRHSDVEAGIANKLYVVGCDFGFSSGDELLHANVIIKEFNQLIDIINGQK